MGAGRDKLGFQAAWSMAVGGMIGGGIFATLGVVISLAGSLAWLSFLLGGVVAFLTGRSYVRLTVADDREGGAYRFLRDEGRPGFASAVAWGLVLGYVLTVSVYAFTFGAYLAHALGGAAWLPRATAAAAIIAIAGINLLGVGKASAVEIGAVWFKLIILVGLALFGIARWSPDQLAVSGQEASLVGALVGAASVFMAYEGFQLLAYDYGEMEDAKKTLRTAMTIAIVTTIAVYILVALGAAMLSGANTIVEQKEVALADAGRAALGTTGFVAVTIAAAFSTASAINATMFATARLSRDVAEEGGMPSLFAKDDEKGVPYAGILSVATAALLLAMIGGLQQLVQGASVVFLAVFALVNGLAAKRGEGRIGAMIGAVCATLATIALVAHFFGAI